MKEKTNKNIEKILSITLITFLSIFNTEANAQVSSDCQQSMGLNINGWLTTPPNGSFQDGQVIASSEASTTFYHSALAKYAFLDGGGRRANFYRFDAVPMPLTPGVGVRISWSGIWSHSNYGFTTTSKKPQGTRLSQPYWYTLLTGHAPSSFSITYSFYYEIVIIDASKYKGGKPVFTKEADIQAVAYSSNTSSGERECQNGRLDLMDVLVKNTNLPELPRPPVPTCASADLNVVATMPPVTVSQLAAYRSNRNQGVVGQYNFNLVGKQCPRDTTIKAYFTDTRAASASNDYIKSSHPSVGVRLYHRDTQTPIQLGPSPIGSTLPSRLPVVEGPSTSSMSTMYMPITAQYVALPGTDNTAVTPGSMQAEAVATFIYD